MAEDVDLYDTSEYPPDHYLYSTKNKKVPGLMKDDFGGKIITEYYGLRSKLYYVDVANASPKVKAKGVAKATIKKEIKKELYQKSLFEDISYRHEMKRLRSVKHQIRMESVNKISISPLDTKRWIKDDRVNTLAYGHYNTNTIREQARYQSSCESSNEECSGDSSNEESSGDSSSEESSGESSCEKSVEESSGESSSGESSSGEYSCVESSNGESVVVNSNLYDQDPTINTRIKTYLNRFATKFSKLAHNLRLLNKVKKVWQFIRSKIKHIANWISKLVS